MDGSPAIGLINHIRLADLTSGIDRGGEGTNGKSSLFFYLSVLVFLLLLGSVLIGSRLDDYRLSMYVSQHRVDWWVRGGR